MSRKKMIIAASVLALSVTGLSVSPADALFNSLKSRISQSQTFQNMKQNAKTMGGQVASTTWAIAKQTAAPVIEQTKQQLALQAQQIQSQVQANMMMMATTGTQAVAGGIGAGMGAVNAGMARVNQGIATGSQAVNSGMANIPTPPANQAVGSETGAPAYPGND